MGFLYSRFEGRYFFLTVEILEKSKRSPKIFIYELKKYKSTLRNSLPLWFEDYFFALFDLT